MLAPNSGDLFSFVHCSLLMLAPLCVPLQIGCYETSNPRSLSGRPMLADDILALRAEAVAT